MGLFDFLSSGYRIPLYFYGKKQLDELQKKLGYRFKKLELLGEALSHRSYTQTSENAPFQSYERLEFLGDSVLGMVVAEELFSRFGDMGEGELTKTKAVLVNVHTLSKICGEIFVSDFVKLSDEEEKAGGRNRESILADCLEAVIGAIYLDGGIKPVREFIQKNFMTRLSDVLNDTNLRNYKGELLEFVQANSTLSPYYEIIKTEGPDHRKKFTVGAYLKDKKIGEGMGLSKKEAEQHAAANSLKKLYNLKKKKKDFFDKLEAK